MTLFDAPPPQGSHPSTLMKAWESFFVRVTSFRPHPLAALGLFLGLTPLLFVYLTSDHDPDREYIEARQAKMAEQAKWQRLDHATRPNPVPAGSPLANNYSAEYNGILRAEIARQLETTLVARRCLDKQPGSKLPCLQALSRARITQLADTEIAIQRNSRLSLEEKTELGTQVQEMATWCAALAIGRLDLVDP